MLCLITCSDFNNEFMKQPVFIVLLCVLQNYDNGDSQLDSAELLKFIQHNETAVQMSSYAEEENNRLLRLKHKHSFTHSHNYSGHVHYL